MIGFSSIDEVWDTPGPVNNNNTMKMSNEVSKVKDPVNTNETFQEKIRMETLPVVTKTGAGSNHSVTISDSNVMSKLSKMSKTEQTSYVQKLIRKDTQMGDSFTPDITDIDLFIKIFIALIVFEFLKTLLFPSNSQE